MPFRIRRRRLQLHRRRGSIAGTAVVLLTASGVAAIAATERPSQGATSLIARHGAVAASALQAGVAPPDDVSGPDAIGSLPALASAPPATAPALPGPDDSRLKAIPHFPALPVNAGPRAVNVPILMYHFLRVDTNPNDALGWRLSVTPRDFAFQLALLKREGYTSVSLGDVIDAIDNGKQLPARPIVLTFDDGYANFATVGVPLLKEAGFTATSFVVSGFVGRPGFMSVDQVRDAAAQGMTIGAHTQHHVDLARVPWSVAQREIAGSRADLQKMCGQPVTDFAYPSGQFNQTVVGLVQQAGFRDAVTTISGFTHPGGLNDVMTRVRVSGGESLMAFAQSLGWGPPAAAPARAGSSAQIAPAQTASSAPLLPAATPSETSSVVDPRMRLVPRGMFVF